MVCKIFLLKKNFFSHVQQTLLSFHFCFIFVVRACRCFFAHSDAELPPALALLCWRKVSSRNTRGLKSTWPCVGRRAMNVSSPASQLPPSFLKSSPKRRPCKRARSSTRVDAARSIGGTAALLPRERGWSDRGARVRGRGRGADYALRYSRDIADAVDPRDPVTSCSRLDKNMRFGLTMHSERRGRRGARRG